MSLKIRLRRQGRANRAAFRFVVMDARMPRDGKYLENLGWYLPCQLENNIQVNEERINFWLGQGAELTENAEKLIGMAAPEVIKQLNAKKQAKKLKMLAKRKAKKKAKPVSEKADEASSAPKKKEAAPKKTAAKPRKNASKPKAKPEAVEVKAES